MNAGVGIGLFICLVIIVIFGVAFKYYTDRNIECLETRVNHLDIFYSGLDKSYYSLDKRCDDMFDIIKMQQEEIKELRRMIKPEDEKKCCCGNCRFYHELNERDSVCLNVDVNNCHKTETTLFANNIPFSWTIKGVKPNDCCEHYESMEASDE